jgi:hypothetical protein
MRDLKDFEEFIKEGIVKKQSVEVLERFINLYLLIINK